MNNQKSTLKMEKKNSNGTPCLSFKKGKLYVEPIITEVTFIAEQGFATSSESGDTTLKSMQFDATKDTGSWI